MIHRTCGRCGCAYEWGVHAAFFAERTGLTTQQLQSTACGGAGDPGWSNDERLLIRLADELHDTAGLSEDLWNAVRAAYSLQQILELIALAGFYHRTAPQALMPARLDSVTQPWSNDATSSADDRFNCLAYHGTAP